MLSKLQTSFPTARYETLYVITLASNLIVTLHIELERWFEI